MDTDKILDLFHQVNAMAGTQYYQSGDYEAKVEALSQLMEADTTIEQCEGTPCTTTKT